MKFANWDYLYKNKAFYIKHDKETPPSFFKYYSVTEKSIDSFTKSQFFFSHPLHFNDPFDSSFQLIDLTNLEQNEIVNFYSINREFTFLKNVKDHHSLRDKIIKALNTEKKDFINRTLTYYWNMIFKEIGIFSMTGSGENLLLWSYYNSHKGFAVEFADFPIDNLNTFGPFPVNYAANYEVIYPKNAELKNEELLYLTNIKSDQWKHEEEWRIILKRKDLSIPHFSYLNHKNENRLFNYSPSIIKSVILGFSFFAGFYMTLLGEGTNDIEVEIKDLTDSTLKLKAELLNHLVSNHIKVKQVQTEDDKTFKVRTVEVKELIEIEKFKKYQIRLEKHK